MASAFVFLGVGSVSILLSFLFLLEMFGCVLLLDDTTNFLRILIGDTPLFLCLLVVGTRGQSVGCMDEMKGRRIGQWVGAEGLQHIGLA